MNQTPKHTYPFKGSSILYSTYVRACCGIPCLGAPGRTVDGHLPGWPTLPGTVLEMVQTIWAARTATSQRTYTQSGNLCHTNTHTHTHFLCVYSLTAGLSNDYERLLPKKPSAIWCTNLSVMELILILCRQVMNRSSARADGSDSLRSSSEI